MSTAKELATGAVNNTVVGQSILISGKLTGDEDLTVQGRVEGELTLSREKLPIGDTNGQLLVIYHASRARTAPAPWPRSAAVSPDRRGQRTGGRRRSRNPIRNSATTNTTHPMINR